jgi:hypothetical protein
MLVSTSLPEQGSIKERSRSFQGQTHGSNPPWVDDKAMLRQR